MVNHLKLVGVSVFVAIVAVVAVIGFHILPLPERIPGTRHLARVDLANVRSVAVSPHGNVVVAATDDDIAIYDRVADRIVMRLGLPGALRVSMHARPLEFSPDGRLLAACFAQDRGRDVVRVWDTRHWTIVKYLEDAGQGHGCRSIAFSSDSATLVRVFDRPIANEGPSIVYYATDDWSEIRCGNTAPFYPYDVRSGSSPREVWMVGEVVNPQAWNLPGEPPTFGRPAMHNTSVLVGLNRNSCHIRTSIPLPIDVSPTSSLAISPDARYADIHGRAGVVRVDLRSREIHQEQLALALDRPSSLVHLDQGTRILEAVYSDHAGYISVRAAVSGQAQFTQHTSAIAGGISFDAKTLVLGFENHVDLYAVDQAGGLQRRPN